MVMQRYDPFRNAISLRTMMEHLFDESFLRPFGNATTGAALALDVSETNDAYVVKASMPGVKPDDVQIMLNGNTITIRGEAQAEDERKEQDYIVRERRAGIYERTFTLPASVDAERAEARFEDGVLTLTIPKHERVRARQVKVSHTARHREGSNEDHGQQDTRAQGTNRQERLADTSQGTQQQTSATGDGQQQHATTASEQQNAAPAAAQRSA